MHIIVSFMPIILAKLPISVNTFPIVENFKIVDICFEKA